MSGYLEHALQEYEFAVEAACADQARAATRKHETIMFGVAAITLDAARAESVDLPQQIRSELDQAVCLVYAMRCCPAHDISEPVWKLNEKYRRHYDIAGLHVDLTGVQNQPFDIAHVGGPTTLRHLANYLRENGAIGSAT